MEIVRHHGEGRDVQHPLSDSKADSLDKQNLIFNLMGRRIHWWQNDGPDNIDLVE